MDNFILKNEIFKRMDNKALNAIVNLAGNLGYRVEQIGNDVPCVIRSVADKYAPTLIFNGDKNNAGFLKIKFQSETGQFMPADYVEYEKWLEQHQRAKTLGTLLMTIEYGALPSHVETEIFFENEKKKLQEKENIRAKEAGEKPKKLKFPMPIAF